LAQAFRNDFSALILSPWRVGFHAIISERAVREALKIVQQARSWTPHKQKNLKIFQNFFWCGGGV
jgi:hypothetical protein